MKQIFRMHASRIKKAFNSTVLVAKP